MGKIRFWIGVLWLLFFVAAMQLDARIVFRVPFRDASLEDSFRIVSDSLRSMANGEDVEVRIASGVHRVRNTIEIQPCGHPLVIRGNKRHSSVITGVAPLSGSVQIQGSVYVFSPRANLDKRKIDFLHIDGTAYTHVKEPDLLKIIRIEDLGKDKNGYSLYKLYVDPDCFRQIVLSEDDAPIAVIIRKWVMNRWEMIDFNEEQAALTVKGQPVPSYNPLSVNCFLFLENVKSEVHAPGEWAIDKQNEIHFLPVYRSARDPELGVADLNTLFSIHGTEGNEIRGVSFQNLCFEGTGVEDLYRRDNIEQASNGLSAAIEVDDARDIQFISCDFRNIANNGIWFRRNCQDCLVTKSNFLQMGAGAIKMGVISKKENDPFLTSSITIQDNIIQGYGRLFMDAVGIIIFNASHNVISHNEISDGHYSAISIGWTWGYSFSPATDNEISYNHVHDIGDKMMSDMGGVYYLGDATGSSIHHNIIHDVSSPFDNAWGIYADEGTSRLLVENNLVYNCTSGGFHQHYGQQNIVRNNVFAFNEHQQITITTIKEKESLDFYSNVLIANNGSFYSGVGINSGSVHLDNNCYWSTSGEGLFLSGLPLEKWISTREPGSVIVNPQIRGGQRGYYTVKNKQVIKAIGFKEFSIKEAGSRVGRK